MIDKMTPELKRCFFEDFEKRSISDNELRARIEDFPEEQKGLVPEVASVTGKNWESFKKICCGNGSIIPSRKDVEQLLEKRTRILQDLPSVRQAEPASALASEAVSAPVLGLDDGERAAATASLSASSPSPTEDAPPARQIEDSAFGEGPARLPLGFEALFGPLDRPVSGARSAMMLVLNDPVNRTEDLQLLLQWCKDRRPADLFEDYAVTTWADPLPEPAAEHPVEQDFDEQMAWVKDNFSEKRYEALIALRDKLRRSGQLPFVRRPSEQEEDKKKVSGAGVQRGGACSLKTVVVCGVVFALLVIGGVVVYSCAHVASSSSHGGGLS